MLKLIESDFTKASRKGDSAAVALRDCMYESTYVRVICQILTGERDKLIEADKESLLGRQSPNKLCT